MNGHMVRCGNSCTHKVRLFGDFEQVPLPLLAGRYDVLNRCVPEERFGWRISAVFRDYLDLRIISLLVVARRDGFDVALLMDRVGTLVRHGKSLDDIKKELKIPEYASWGSQDRKCQKEHARGLASGTLAQTEPNVLDWLAGAYILKQEW